MGDWLSLPGLIGALIGAALGFGNFRVVIGIVEQRLRMLDRSASAAEKAEFDGRIVLMKRLVFVLTVPVIAGVGYVVGRQFGG